MSEEMKRALGAHEWYFHPANGPSETTRTVFFSDGSREEFYFKGKAPEWAHPEAPVIAYGARQQCHGASGVDLTGFLAGEQNHEFRDDATAKEITARIRACQKK